MDCDGSLDPRELPRVVTGPVLAGRADLVLGARAAGARCLAAARPGGQPRRWRSSCAGARASRTARPRADARRAAAQALLELGIRDRRFGWPLEMVLRAADAGWRIEEVAVPYRARAGPLEGDRHACAAPPARCATWRRRCGERAHAAGDRQGAGARAVEDAAVPAVHARAGGGAGRGGAGRHAGRRGGTAGARRVIVLDGAPGAWLPPGFEVVPQRGDGLGERLAAAFADCGGPAFLVAMDTPQLTAAAARSTRSTRSSGPAWTRCSGPPPTAATGASASPRRCARRVRRRADVHAPAPARPSARGSASSGLRWPSCPPLRDVDTIDDARAVAARARRDTRFAAGAARPQGTRADDHQPVPEAAA